MSKKNIKIGIFGFGCVGQGLYHVLNKTKGINAEIVKICVKDKNKERTFPSPSYFTFEKEEILNNPDIDVVVELIDDAEAAHEIVTTAMINGKSVVTANKKLVAENIEELVALQRKHNVSLLYEAACCGSIPIIRNLEEYYDNDLLDGFEGIFNGSSNYILTKIFQEGLDFSTALKQAQENGFAESDPTLDIEGFDAAFKLSIALSHAYGLFIQPHNILNIGISNIAEADIHYAKKKDYTIKLIAQCKKIGDEVFALVAPQFINNEETLSQVNNEFNAVIVEAAFSEKQLFIGKGAGSYPTGSAVLSDLSALTYDYKYEYKKNRQKLEILYSNDYNLNVYVSFADPKNIDLDDFDEILEEHISRERNYIVGRIKYEKLVKSNWKENKDVSIILNEKEKFENILQPNKLDFFLEEELISS